MDEENKNIFSIVKGGATEEQDDDTLPINTYRIVDVDGDDYFDDGFLVFTSQHVAVMRETAKGAIPVLVVPLDRVKYTELVEDDED